MAAHLSLPSIQFKLLFKFQNVLNHSLGRNLFFYFFHIYMKEGIPTALEAFLRFETNRRINKSSTKAISARVIRAEELGAMSKTNLRLPLVSVLYDGFTLLP